MRAESVGLIASCAECDALWLPADVERWSAYLTDDEPPELAFYCPDCAEREFKWHRSADTAGEPEGIRAHWPESARVLAAVSPCRNGYFTASSAGETTAFQSWREASAPLLRGDCR